VRAFELIMKQDAAVTDTARLTYTVDEVAYLLNLSRGIVF